MFLQIAEHMYIQTTEIQTLMRSGENSSWIFFRNGKQINVPINVHDLIALLEEAAGEKIIRDKSLFYIGG